VNPSKRPASHQEPDRFSASIDTLLKNLSDTGRGRKQAISIAIDFILAVSCLWIAYSLRFGLPFLEFKSTWYVFLYVPPLTVAIFAGFGVYRWVVRSTNARLTKQIAKGAVFASLALLIVLFLLPPDKANSRSLFVIFGLLLAASTLGVRLVWQELFSTGSKGEPVAVYGAGSAGRQLVRLLSVGGSFTPVAFIDDNATLYGSTMSGLPVLDGAAANLKAELKRLEANSIVLAMPSLTSNEYQAKLKALDALGLPVRTLPSVAEIMSGSARVDEIRDISLNDILGRSEVEPNVALMGKRVTGKTVLVTGGGGSIGSELCRQVMRLSPKHLIVLDNGEANLYHITEELHALPNDKSEVLGTGNGVAPEFTPVLGSINDAASVDRLMAEHKIDTVFHGRERLWHVERCGRRHSARGLGFCVDIYR